MAGCGRVLRGWPLASYAKNENGLPDVIRISEMAGGSCLGAQRKLLYINVKQS